jgi:predicted nucleic acid-binding protein
MGEENEAGAPYDVWPARVDVIHLDTSFLIKSLVRDSAEDRSLRNWLKTGEAVAMSALAWTELLCGPLEESHLDLISRVVSERAPFLEEDAVLSARLFIESGRRRGSLMDCMIAASALRAGASLATANARDFRRFAAAGLTLVGG